MLRHIGPDDEVTPQKTELVRLSHVRDRQFAQLFQLRSVPFTDGHIDAHEPVLLDLEVDVLLERREDPLPPDFFQGTAVKDVRVVLGEGQKEGVNSPLPDDLISGKRRDGLGSPDSVGQFLSGAPPRFTLRPSLRAACSSKPHPESCRQGPDDAAICCTDQTM